MSYNFKDDLASRLPEGYSIYQIYALNEDISRIEGVNGQLKTFFELKKVDLTEYLFKIPTISLPGPCTVNDLYARLSDIYGLGLVINVDYYDSTPLNPSSAHQYVELPISNNSYGYKGTLRCYVVLGALEGINPDVERDVSSVDITASLNKIKFRNFIMGSVIGIDEIKFVENSLSLEFVTKIIAAFKGQVPDSVLEEYRLLLSSARVLEKYSDGLSDLVVISVSQELFQIRYSYSLKNNGENDNTSDNSQGLPDGDTDSSAENPVSGEGDYINTEQSEDPYSSTEGNNTIEEVEIQIE
ncbi:hypothetical protein AH04_117 [Erwinia phage AH04]|uniref:Uncharacterized protein n=1 Tax=Erwinia phage AH04 TaxID=2869569 RepID=A0AAE7X0L1_9CAUD|nr:hypothetical protein PQC02_gp197 [Erwinia phage AH04]QZA70597.1 hypothetical protein AH04_117 [Erwinia phage AH04]